MPIRRGDTVIFPHPPVLAAWAAVGGKKESEGPLAQGFDELVQDAGFDAEGCTGWEQAESMLQQRCARHCLRKAGIAKQQVELAFAGDLQAQCTASNYTMRQLGVPFAGLYGACSTSAEGLLLAAALVSAGFAACAGVVTSSHNAAAERQFRTPLEYGGQRPQSGQWTVTGAGAFLVVPGCSGDTCPLYPVGTAPLSYIRAGMAGIVLDRGVTDANNMGAAMAPAAESTLCCLLRELGAQPTDFDCIVTGDLGWEGSRILCDLMDTHSAGGVSLSVRDRHNDCGCMIFSRSTQDTHSGGSGCGCSAAVLASYLLPRIQSGHIRRMLYLATGALMSPDSLKQGRSIPGVAHLLCLETPESVTAPQLHL